MKKTKQTPKIQARVSAEEMHLIIQKAHLYAFGNVSQYIRLAVLNYKGKKK